MTTTALRPANPGDTVVLVGPREGASHDTSNGWRHQPMQVRTRDEEGNGWEGAVTLTTGPAYRFARDQYRIVALRPAEVGEKAILLNGYNGLNDPGDIGEVTREGAYPVIDVGGLHAALPSPDGFAILVDEACGDTPHSPGPAPDGVFCERAPHGPDDDGFTSHAAHAGDGTYWYWAEDGGVIRSNSTFAKGLFEGTASEPHEEPAVEPVRHEGGVVDEHKLGGTPHRITLEVTLPLTGTDPCREGVESFADEALYRAVYDGTVGSDGFLGATQADRVAIAEALAVKVTDVEQVVPEIKFQVGDVLVLSRGDATYTHAHDGYRFVGRSTLTNDEANAAVRDGRAQIIARNGEVLDTPIGA